TAQARHPSSLQRTRCRACCRRASAPHWPATSPASSFLSPLGRDFSRLRRAPDCRVRGHPSHPFSLGKIPILRFHSASTLLAAGAGRQSTPDRSLALFTSIIGPAILILLLAGPVYFVRGAGRLLNFEGEQQPAPSDFSRGPDGSAR